MVWAFKNMKINSQKLPPKTAEAVSDEDEEVREEDEWDKEDVEEIEGNSK